MPSKLGGIHQRVNYLVAFAFCGKITSFQRIKFLTALHAYQSFPASDGSFYYDIPFQQVVMVAVKGRNIGFLEQSAMTQVYGLNSEFVAKFE